MERHDLDNVVDSLSQFTWTEDHGGTVFGFGGAGSTGGGQEHRATVFDAYAGGLREAFGGLFDLPAHEAWAEANELVEGPGVEWAHLRAMDDGTFLLEHGSC
jgi:hypothetical protein